VARDTSLFEKKKFVFSQYMPSEHFDKTTAQIFSSNFETLNTLDNVRFVEMISSFYSHRDSYETIVVDSFENDFKRNLQHWDLATALEFQFSTYILMSGMIGESMRNDFQQCKELMGVSDEEFAAFELQKQSQADPEPSVDEKREKYMKEMIENDLRLESAIEEGKNGN
jgi:hypothetical protein